ncbi:hypothetical protein ABIE26_003966 [Pedobacter africanus]|uniref:Uncharacterized protein n=1 Tax=Pedobacter africanus TaxID=151894 RepID=A0ACC6L1F9_9SPHI|nr:hypothetical protein [Pedobacter africanus]MDR6785267.1 hypothetical protein [Pedobacter africanus]
MSKLSEDIEFDENDWDTTSKIKFLNENDAEYNGVDIDTITQMIQHLE